MKALNLLKELKDYYLSIDNDKSIIEKYDEAIIDLELLKLYVKYLEECKRLAKDYVQIQTCSCGTLKVKGYLCSNKKCTEDE